MNEHERGQNSWTNFSIFTIFASVLFAIFCTSISKQFTRLKLWNINWYSPHTYIIFYWNVIGNSALAETVCSTPYVENCKRKNVKLQICLFLYYNIILVKGKKVKFFYIVTEHWAQSSWCTGIHPAGDFKPSTWRYSCHYFPPGLQLPSQPKNSRPGKLSLRDEKTRDSSTG